MTYRQNRKFLPILVKKLANSATAFQIAFRPVISYLFNMIIKNKFSDYGTCFAKYVSESDVNSTTGADHDKGAVYFTALVSIDSFFVGLLAGG